MHFFKKKILALGLLKNVPGNSFGLTVLAVSTGWISGSENGAFQSITVICQEDQVLGKKRNN